MKSILLATAFGVLLSSTAFAGKAEHCDLQSDRCSGKPLDMAQFKKTVFLADQINADLEEMAEAEKAEGRDLKVVIIGRMGSSLDKFRILNDNDGQLNLQQLIQTIAAKADQERSIELQRQLQELKERGEDDSFNKNKLLREANRRAGTFDRDTLKTFINRKESLKYSHLGIAFRNFEIKDKDGVAQTGPATGKWALYHLLYSCQDQKISHIFKGTMHDFFYDHLSGYSAQVVVPSQEVQNNLEDILLKKRRVYRYQTNQYNAVAKIDDLTQQNSNQFVVEALAAAMRPDGEIMSREQAVEQLNKTGFSASKLTMVGAMRALTFPLVGKVVSWFMPTVCFKNQPDIMKHEMGEVITANSVINWMKRNNIVQKEFEVKLSDERMKMLDESTKEEEKEKNGNKT